MKINKILITCIGLFILYIFQLLDIVLTYFGLHIYGVEAEGNPLVKYIIYNTNILVGLLLIKIPAILLIFYILKYLEKLYTNRLFYFVILLNLIYFISTLMWLYLLLL